MEEGHPTDRPWNVPFYEHKGEMNFNKSQHTLTSQERFSLLFFSPFQRRTKGQSDPSFLR